MSEEQKAKKSIFKRWWFWLIILPSAASAILGKMEDNEKESTKSNSSEKNNSAQETKPKDFRIGDKVSIGDMEIVLTNVNRNYDTGNMFFKPKNGKELVKVTVEMTNKSKYDISFNSYNFRMENDDGASRTEKYSLYSVLDDSLDSGQLSPNGRVKGSILFEVPKGSKNLSLIYEKSSIWSSKTVKIKI